MFECNSQKAIFNIFKVRLFCAAEVSLAPAASESITVSTISFASVLIPLPGSKDFNLALLSLMFDLELPLISTSSFRYSIAY